jgi:hypothetical protein
MPSKDFARTEGRRLADCDFLRPSAGACDDEIELRNAQLIGSELALAWNARRILTSLWSFSAVRVRARRAACRICWAASRPAPVG